MIKKEKQFKILRALFDKVVSDYIDCTAQLFEAEEELQKYYEALDKQIEENHRLMDRAEAAEDAVVDANSRVEDYRKLNKELFEKLHKESK